MHFKTTAKIININKYHKNQVRILKSCSICSYEVKHL